MPATLVQVLQGTDGTGMIGDQDSDGDSSSRSSTVLPSAAASGGAASGPLHTLLSCLSRFDAGRFISAELMLLVAATASFARVQSDTYWHLAAGRALLAHYDIRSESVFDIANQFQHGLTEIVDPAERKRLTAVFARAGSRAKAAAAKPAAKPAK